MPRSGQLDGFFYVISGRKGMFKIYGDSWRSPDGVEWERLSDDNGWGRRCYPEVEIVQGQLILIAGQSLRTFNNDVWRSADHGASWEQVCSNAPWEVRAGHHTMWVWDPDKRMDGWQLFSNNVWDCEDQPNRDGKSDFMIEIRDNKIWTFGGDREVMSPWPQDNDVWVAELPHSW